MSSVISLKLEYCNLINNSNYYNNNNNFIKVSFLLVRHTCSTNRGDKSDQIKSIVAFFFGERGKAEYPGKNLKNRLEN